VIPVAMPQQHSPLKIWQVCSANLFLPLRWVACFRSRHSPLRGSPLRPKLCFFWVCAFLVLGGCCAGLQPHLVQNSSVKLPPPSPGWLSHRWGCPALNIAPLPLLWPNCSCHRHIRAVTKAKGGEQHLGGGERSKQGPCCRRELLARGSPQRRGARPSWPWAAGRGRRRVVGTEGCFSWPPFARTASSPRRALPLQRCAAASPSPSQ